MRGQKAEDCDVQPESLDFVLETKGNHGWVLKRTDTVCGDGDWKQGNQLGGGNRQGMEG